MDRDPAECVAESTCNWFDCETAYYDAATCQSTCEDTSLSVNTCIDCTASSGGFCVERALTQLECESGVCSLDKTVLDAATCSGLSICETPVFTSTTPELDLYPTSLTFTAANESDCLSRGVCSSYIDINYYLTQDPWLTAGSSGLCLSPVIAVACSYYIPIGEGCPEDAYLNQTDCEGAGYIWRMIATDEQSCM
jgi:hypothetical protein